MKKYIVFAVVCMNFLLINLHAQDAIIKDSKHYSNVFGEIRNYRIFLPPSYNKNENKRYPVIYFFHGWGQRYFGEGAEEYAGYDSGEQNKGDNIANFVAKHDVIVVKADGYNRRKDEEYYRRPYNVLPVETYRQFPIYFPELVGYIDDHYRTLNDRQHRAVSGLSMGGFMTFFLAAKYPHMVSSAGSFCGAPEFTIGPYDFPVEYKHMDMYRNLAGINVRLNYGDKDFIRSYHHDMNRTWSQLMDNYTSKIYDAQHSTCGLGDMFTAIMQTFDKPLPVPARFDHIEVYPEFDVWGYHVSTDRAVPGFTVLENVDKRGFRTAVREYVPDGQVIRNVNVIITTPPVYEKNQAYIVNNMDLSSGKSTQQTIISDNAGKLSISVDGGIHEIGINKTNDKAEVAVVSFNIQDAGWVTTGKENKITLTLINKGATVAKNVSVTISPFRNSVQMKSSKVQIGDIAVNTQRESTAPFSFTVVNDTVDIAKFKLDITEGNNRWTQYIDIPVNQNAEAFREIVIADGRTLNVVTSGINIEPVTLGKGNGDGIANPGESIVVLVKDSGKLWRTDLSFNDKYLNPNGIVTRKSDWWTDMDHVGASAKYDEVLIAGDCPQQYSAAVYAEYWTAEYPYHHVKSGTAKITVSGKDQTPPSIEYIQFGSDNTIEAKIIDGGKVAAAAARLNEQNDLQKNFVIDLKDDGNNGDRVAGDNIFSAKIADNKFKTYRVIVSAKDNMGNETSREEKLIFVAH